MSAKSILPFAVLLLLIPLRLQANQENDTAARDQLTQSEQSLLRSFGPWPPESIPHDPGNELSGAAWAEQLGELLFNDPDLSANSTISCASCHKTQNGFAENLPVAMGEQQHVRNTQGLFNAGLQRWFGWDGGADSLWSAALRPLLSPVEMASDIDLLAGRIRAKPGIMHTLASQREQGLQLDINNDEALVVMAAKAIAAYTRTLVSPPTRFDLFRQSIIDAKQNTANTMSPSAIRGLKIFFGEANCHVCHFGANFSNGEFHDTGRPFFTSVGQVDPGRYTGIQRVRTDKYNLIGAFSNSATADDSRKTGSVKLTQENFGQWRTPSLRELASTAPYMHDGSLKTLRDVVDAYADVDPDRLHSNGESILKPLALSDDQRNDLVAFLLSLSATEN